MTTDRPTDTDNARAESAWIEWAQDVNGTAPFPDGLEEARELAREYFIEGAEWAAGRAETTTEHEHDWKRQQNVTTKGYAMPPIEVCRAEGCDAARRAETTTATTANAEEVLHGAGWFARTRPTRDEIARTLKARFDADAEGWLDMADAVLALLRDDQKEAHE